MLVKYRSNIGCFDFLFHTPPAVRDCVGRNICQLLVNYWSNTMVSTGVLEEPSLTTAGQTLVKHWSNKASVLRSARSAPDQPPQGQIDQYLTSVFDHPPPPLPSHRPAPAR